VVFDGLTARSISDGQIEEGIRQALARQGLVLCPHTAAGYVARAEFAGPAIVAATAHPSKFDTIVEPLIGRTVPIPPALAALMERATHETRVPPTLDALRAHLQGA
jgi:threonine synthase